MKMKYNTLISLTRFLFIGLLFLPDVPLASEGSNKSISAAGFDIKSLFFSTENSNQEPDISMAGPVVDALRLHNVSKRDIRNINSGMNYISLSYEGSSGLLGFSSGYIYSAENENGFLMDNVSEQGFIGNAYDDAMTNVYMGFDVGHSISLSQDIELGLRAGVIFLEDIYDEKDDGTVSLLFVMPLEINNSVTIAPKMHWFRSFTDDLSADKEFQPKKEAGMENSGSFYGGVSITFAY